MWRFYRPRGPDKRRKEKDPLFAPSHGACIFLVCLLIVQSGQRRMGRKGEAIVCRVEINGASAEAPEKYTPPFFFSRPPEHRPLKNRCCAKNKTKKKKSRPGSPSFAQFCRFPPVSCLSILPISYFPTLGLFFTLFSSGPFERHSFRQDPLGEDLVWPPEREQKGTDATLVPLDPFGCAIIAAKRTRPLYISSQEKRERGARVFLQTPFFISSLFYLSTFGDLATRRRGISTWLCACANEKKGQRKKGKKG